MCSIDGCNRTTYMNSDKCILHCDKAEFVGNTSTVLDFEEEFENYLAGFVIDETKDSFVIYDGISISREFLKEFIKHDGVSDEYFSEDETVRDECNKKSDFIKNNIPLILRGIHFPECTKEDINFLSSKISLFRSAHFVSCDFLVDNLVLNLPVIFTGCTFQKDWTLRDFSLLDKDLALYTSCTFCEGVSAAEISLSEKQFYACSFFKLITFVKVKFTKELFFMVASTFNVEGIHMMGCSFDGRFIFSNAKNFSIDTLVFAKCNFSEKFEFKNNEIKSLKIDDCNFESVVDMHGSIFNNFTLYQSIFKDFAGFESCKVTESIALFKYVTFEGIVSYREADFQSGLDIELTNIIGNAYFLKCDMDFNGTSRETYRIIKDSFDQNGNHIEANKFYAYEMKKYKQELSNKKGLLSEKVIFFLNEKISNFGQSYIKPIIWFFITLLVLKILKGNVVSQLLANDKGIPHINSNIIVPFNAYIITPLMDFLNHLVLNVKVFEPILIKDMEFASLIFYIIFSTLIWQTLVAVKRLTRR